MPHEALGTGVAGGGNPGPSLGADDWFDQELVERADEAAMEQRFGAFREQIAVPSSEHCTGAFRIAGHRGAGFEVASPSSCADGGRVALQVGDGFRSELRIALEGLDHAVGATSGGPLVGEVGFVAIDDLLVGGGDEALGRIDRLRELLEGDVTGPFVFASPAGDDELSAGGGGAHRDAAAGEVADVASGV